MRSPSGPHKSGQSNWRLHWLLCPPRGLAGTPDIAIRCNRQKQFVLYGPVDLEFRMAGQVPVYGRLRTVSRAPWSLARQLLGHVFHDGVENHAVAAPGRQGRVGLELRKNMVGGVVAVQAHENP